jgi:hypothetical protein
MVARINFGKSVAKALNYNEHKCKEGQAQLLGSANTLLPAASMNFYEKRAMFEKFTSLNQRSQLNSLHVSLNFDPSERLDKERLLSIAGVYMKGIGFGAQPYLVYEHRDTGHPHIHIVSTTIQVNGKRILTHNLGRDKSEPIRKKIEVDFSLVQASSKSKLEPQLSPIEVKRIGDGPRQTKRAMANVLHQVLPLYHFCSLTELNALLGLYNLKADTCAIGSFTQRHGGLLYRVLDAAGRPSGTPIKASVFSMKPTLANLEKLFARNLPARKSKLKGLTSSIDFVLLSKSIGNLRQFSDQLERHGISLVQRIGNNGALYGLTYIDHKRCVVVNGSDLGTNYAAHGILSRLQVNLSQISPAIKEIKLDATVHSVSPSADPADLLAKQLELFANGNEPKTDYIPWQLKGRKRKKRQKK